VLSVVAALAAVLAPDRGAGTSRVVADSVAFLDARTGQLRGDMTLAESDTGYLRTGGGWIWDKKDSGVLLQIDPRSLQLAHSYAIGRTIGGFAVGAGALWFVGLDSRTLIRIDQRYGVGTRRIPLSPQADPNLGPIAESADVAFADGSVWVAHGLAQVDRVDPASGRVVHRFPIRDASVLAEGDGAIWVASSDLGVLTKIDPATDAIVATARIRPWIAALQVGGGSVWASNNDLIWKLSPDSELLDTIKIPFGTGEFAFADGALWNTSLGTLVRVDAQTDATHNYHVGHLLSGVATSGNVVAVDVSRTAYDVVAALKGRVLRVRFGQDWIDDPDPAIGGEPGANEWPWLQQLLYATTARLLTYRESAAPGGWQLVPEIAANLPSVSRDGRTYTFRIRPGFRFSPPSNQPVTAQTFKYSIERALSPMLGDNAPAVAVASDILGVSAYRDRKAAHVSGISAHGDELTVTLRRPAPDFPERMAFTYFAPVPIGTPVVLNGLRDPIPSAGPYYLASNEGGVVAVARRNPNYHGPRPHQLDALAFQSQTDVSQAVRAIMAGRADYIAEPASPLSGAQLASSYGAQAGGKRRYFRTALLGVDELAFNTTRGIFASPNLRRAVNFALDRPAIAAALDDLPGDRYLPPGIPGYHTAHVYPLNGPDVERARSLAGTTSRHATLDVCSQPRCAEVARIVAADLQPIGIRTTVRQYSGDLAATIARPGADIVLARVYAPYPDPVAMLRAELGKPFAARLDALAQLDRPERLNRAERFELDVLQRNAPAAAIGTPTIPEFFSARVGCKTFQPLFFGVDLAGLCLRT
jgi:ABC-type transport system substrate-binding protein